MISRAAKVLLLTIAMVLVTACGVYVPKGATVVVVKNTNQTFDRGEMRPMDQLRAGELIKMRWYDDNTYMTTATLTPGMYSFRARNYQGGGLEREIRIEPDKHLYEVDGGVRPTTESADSAANALKLTGKVVSAPGRKPPPSVAILFIGTNIEMRTANVGSDGSFSSAFPQKGPWRIEVHIAGNPPRSYVHDVMNVQSAVNLGNITLK